MITPICDISIPSHMTLLLSSLVGRKLMKMVRYNSEPIERLINEFEIEPQNFFALCDGSILLYFEDGLVVGVGDNPSQNSLLIWVEKNEVGETGEWLLEEWDEAIPFYAQDFEFWKQFLGKIIVSVTIIKQIDINDENPKINSLPSERGLLFNFDNKLSFIISYGLNSPSYDTTIITPEQINPYFNGRLVYDQLA